MRTQDLHDRVGLPLPSLAVQGEGHVSTLLLLSLGDTEITTCCFLRSLAHLLKARKANSVLPAIQSLFDRSTVSCAVSVSFAGKLQVNWSLEDAALLQSPPWRALTPAGRELGIQPGCGKPGSTFFMESPLRLIPLGETAPRFLRLKR